MMEIARFVVYGPENMLIYTGNNEQDAFQLAIAQRGDAEVMSFRATDDNSFIEVSSSIYRDGKSLNAESQKVTLRPSDLEHILEICREHLSLI